jgi:uncharacterized membrane protein YkoI
MKLSPVPIIALALLAGLGQASARAAPAPVPSGYDSLGADWGSQQDEARTGVAEGRYLPLARVIAEIRRRRPGRQLDAGLEESAGRAVYRVRWAAKGGQRIDYIVDASTGAILGVQGR